MNTQPDSFFQLKAGLVPLTVIKITQLDTNGINNQLKNAIQKAPKYFRYMPILLDMGELTTAKQSDLDRIFQLLRTHDLIPIGVKGLNDKYHQQIRETGIAIFNHSATKPNHPNSQRAKHETPKKVTKIITKPIRSGTQVFSTQGDLIILAGVNSGAECLAEGNIHIYGPLRGRALAGMHGDEHARIFCQSLDAELVAIAGHYQVNSQLKSHKLNNCGMIQIYLKNKNLQLEPI